MQGDGSLSDVIYGIQWAVRNKDKCNIRVISLSLGGPALQKEKMTFWLWP
jgi:serine protease AprX